MKFIEDPRVKVSRRCLLLAWIFFFVYLAAIMVASYVPGVEPYVIGLPRWVAIGNIGVPLSFVVLLIFVVELLIPDIPLTDDEEGPGEEE